AVYLIIEIADTTLNRDLGMKVNLYAAADITDYWIFDVAKQQLHVFRDPETDGYQRQLILGTQQSISPLAFSDYGVRVQECFGLMT
ncbi:MAG: Uma2 family endonuclease, partial [Cyanobacteria bacterium J06636_16]